MKRLGVNIDHVATLRNARGESHPNPVNVARFIKKKGINSVTIHLREDRRHIKDIDAKKICKIKNLKVNLEISTKKEYVFRNPEDFYELPVEFGKHQLWLLSLKTDQTIIPKEHDPNSTDDRKLGVRIMF